MRIVVATICDYAQIREGLFTIVSAGITRLWRDQLPQPMAVFLALQVEVPSQERPFPHEVGVDIAGPSGQEVAKLRAAFQVGAGGDFDPDESVLVSLPLDLRPISVAAYGWHTVAISLDSGEPYVLRVKVARRPALAPDAGIQIAPPSRRSH